MSLKYIWGFGGVRLRVPALQPLEAYTSSSQYDCVLPYAIADMAFEPINVVYTTLDQEQHVINMGYRGKFSVSATNTCVNDFTEFVKLIDILNAGSQLGYDITLYPRWDTTGNNLSYNVRCTSSVNFESVAPTKTAQNIELKFETLGAVPTLPTLTSDPSTFSWVYSQDAGVTTDNLVTGTGDTLIFHV